MTTIRLSSIRTQGGAGVSLDGPSNIQAGNAGTYTITDYDSFSTYEVVTDVGTVSVSDETITLSIPPGEADGVVTMIVSRNGAARPFFIAVAGTAIPIIATPSFLYPVTGQTGVNSNLTLQASVFTSIPVGTLQPTSSEWQVAIDTAFVGVIANGTVSSGDFSRFTAQLDINTQYYARMRYYSGAVVSAWTPTSSFKTSDQSVATPTVSIQEGQVNVGRFPAFTGSTFQSIPVGSDSHVSSTWIVRKVSDNSIVWQKSNSTTDKLSITIDEEVLAVSTNYSVEVQYNGAVSRSLFSQKVIFTTRETFFPRPVLDAGMPFGGGYYAGANIIDDGVEYALIVAPKALGGEKIDLPILAPNSSHVALMSSLSETNGLQNTQRMLANGILSAPAAYFCASLTIGGYTDWYLPSSLELEIAYRYLKPNTTFNNVFGTSNLAGKNPASVPVGERYTQRVPTQTTSALFRSPLGNEAFIPGGSGANYLTSTMVLASSTFANLRRRFDDGLENTVYLVGGVFPGTGTTQLVTRAFRRVRVV